MKDDIENRVADLEGRMSEFETAFFGTMDKPGLFEMARRTNETVEKMNTTVESLREDRWKVKGALGAAGGIGGIIGWIVSLFTSGK